MAKYLSQLCLIATGILWWYAGVEFFDNRNLQGVLMFMFFSFFPAFAGLIFAED